MLCYVFVKEGSGHIRTISFPCTANIDQNTICLLYTSMLMSDIRHDFIQTKILSFQNASMDELNAMWKSQIDEAHKILASEGLKEDQAVFTFIADMRYAGQEHTVQVQAPAYPWKEEDRAEICLLYTSRCV